jgi:hypothetical protein
MCLAVLTERKKMINKKIYNKADEIHEKLIYLEISKT